jgi:hypothetical protein
MDYTNSDNPITVTKGMSNWYAQTISREALLRIPDEFKQVPKFEALTFKQREDFDLSDNASWPKETSQMVLALGTFDVSYLDGKPPVFLFVHGPRNHHIGYFYVKSDMSVQRVRRSELTDVDFEEPFCDLGDHSVSEISVCNRIRAIALYYFLAAGYVKDVGNYNRFWTDFTKACEWIANKGSRPTPHGKVLKQNSVPVFAAALESDLDSAIGKPESKKRGSGEEFEPVSGLLHHPHQLCVPKLMSCSKDQASRLQSHGKYDR